MKGVSLMLECVGIGGGARRLEARAGEGVCALPMTFTVLYRSRAAGDRALASGARRRARPDAVHPERPELSDISLLRVSSLSCSTPYISPYV